MTESLHSTLLADWHRQQGANMAAFAGYTMPLWYSTGAKKEHLAAISQAALFDTSHMAILRITGPTSRDLLQRCTTRDLDCCLGKEPLRSGRCVYTLILTEEGHVLDDAILFQLTADDYLFVVNAAMGPVVLDHLGDHADKVILTDLTGQVGKIDLQGPMAGRVLKACLKQPQRVFDNLVPFSFRGTLDFDSTAAVLAIDGTPLLVSRTGYTGEFGFELLLPAEYLVSFWQLLARQPLVTPAGLAARDSLRTGAGLPLSHQDIGPWPFAANPWLFALPWDPKRDGYSKAFIGRRALEELPPQPVTLPFAGFDPRKISGGNESRVTDLAGQPLGTILTCATDMAIDRVNGRIISLATSLHNGRPESFTPRGLCCGFVRLDTSLPLGTQVLLTDGRRNLTVELRDQIRPDRTARSPIETML